jgi:hypothetical protein
MKTEKKESVLHDWVQELPFTQQALLVMATRGADGLCKNNPAKSILHYLRGTILKPAYPNFTGDCDGYMRTDYINFNPIVDLFFNDTDIYPMHFLMHLCHAAEVIGYKHPDETIRIYWSEFYFYFCHSLHMKRESKDELNARLFY